MKTEVFYDLTELKKAKFQLLCDKHGHYWAHKSKSYIICTITGKQFGGEAGLLGGEASPLPPPVDRTLHINRTLTLKYMVHIVWYILYGLPVVLA